MQMLAWAFLLRAIFISYLNPMHIKIKAATKIKYVNDKSIPYTTGRKGKRIPVTTDKIAIASHTA
jgi:hypothetical protein